MDLFNANPLLLIIVSAVGAGIVLGAVMFLERKGIKLFKWWRWPLWGREKPGDEKKEGGSVKYEAVNARVYDNQTRTIYNTSIPGETVKKIRAQCGNLGRKWNRDGKWLYALNKTDTGDYKPVAIPQTLEDPPSSLHRALQQQAVEIFYDVSADKNFMEKYGKILLFVGAVLFLVWTVVMK